MKLDDARKAYYDHSGQLSSIVRQLAFAGIALVWITKAEDPSGAWAVPVPMFRFAALVVLALVFDLLHYAWAAAAWGCLSRSKERAGVSDKEEFLVDPRIEGGSPLLIC